MYLTGSLIVCLREYPMLQFFGEKVKIEKKEGKLGKRVRIPLYYK